MTKKVTCTLPNASTSINEIDFEEFDGGVVARGLSDEQAAMFDGIPGYVVEDDVKELSAAEKKAAAKAAKLEADAKAAAEAEASAAATETPAAVAEAGAAASEGDK